MWAYKYYFIPTWYKKYSILLIFQKKLLCGIGGFEVKPAVRAIMRKIGSAKLWGQFNYAGHSRGSHCKQDINTTPFPEFLRSKLAYHFS